MSRKWLLPALLIVVWLGLGGGLGPIGGKINDVAVSGAAAALPTNAESSEVIRIINRIDGETLPAVAVYARPGGLTAADRAAIAADVDWVRGQLGPAVHGGPIGPIGGKINGAAEQVIVPFAGSDMYKVTPFVDQLRERLSRHTDLAAHVTGPAGIQADVTNALGAIDLMLVIVTAVVILIILLVVYRSPLLPLLVLGIAGTSLGLMLGILYLLVDAGALTMSAEIAGIVNVLVLGAGTDYALLLIARYREELHRHQDKYEAMRRALRASIGPILASASTVVVGLLCLLVSDLGLNRDLGPAGAIGIACAFLAMVTFLPAVLVLLGRNAFWPFKAPYGDAPAAHGKRWAAVGRTIERRPRIIWIGTAIVLAALSLGALRLDSNGLPGSEQVIASDADSKVGQRLLSAHYPPGMGNPAIVTTRADRMPAVIEAASKVPGVDNAMPNALAGAQPRVVDGLVQVNVTLDDVPDSPAAQSTVERLRTAVHAVPGADAKVGGYTAVQVDFNDGAARDRIVIPILLFVVLLMVALLLRALLAPILLVATVVLSFGAAVGVSTWVLRDLFGFPGTNSTYLLHVFVFLVALGVDYNIFLMTRVREETERHGTRRGMVVGLLVTGGVITSAGVVLAATFSVLAVIPLVLMVELSFTVAFGVLLDTFIVRSLLVPALVLDVGRAVWWPSSLAKVTDPKPGAEPVAEPRTEVTA
nr:MMPL family transporter [Kibdelosporangium sp. MJ126-NF4]CEL17829.1 possible membrane protein [Kibdelosporangium sp. MJ126-NF4]CTQ90947.1 possible membrane protein [Kibdelosporangium sp. MJ126-NF4]